MEHLNAPRHKERILEALTKVPIASTTQLSRLNDSLNPRKKASAVLRELQADRLVESQQHGKERVWRLTGKGRKRFGISPTRLSNVDHALAVGNLWFTCSPSHWLFEPVEPFEHEGMKLKWKPDCVMVFQRKLYAVEVQRSYPPGKNPWARKWFIYNCYFNGGHFKTAKYQEWAGGKIVAPNIMVITKQNPDTVKQGFEVRGRELLVVKSIHL